MPERPTALMIFAAGRGTRMAPLTNTMPKPLVPIAGRALIDYALDLADGCAPIVVNTHYLASQLEAHLHGRDLITIHEDALLETGGGLKNAIPLLGDGPVLTLNSDAIWRGPNVLRQLLKNWNPDRMDALLALLDPVRAIGHKGNGDFLLSNDGALTRGPGYVYSGAHLTKLDAVADAPETVFSLNRVWDQLIPNGKLHGTVYPGQWCDVGQPESIALAEGLLNV